jgi:hypothetical protein
MVGLSVFQFPGWTGDGENLATTRLTRHPLSPTQRHAVACRNPTSGTQCPGLGRSRDGHAPASVPGPSPHAAAQLPIQVNLSHHGDTTR